MKNKLTRGLAGLFLVGSLAGCESDPITLSMRGVRYMARRRHE